jgi:hypothetical protein
MNEQTYRSPDPSRERRGSFDRPMGEQQSRGREQAPRFIASLNEAARENPIGAALVGVGIAWLFAGGRRSLIGIDGAAAAGRALSAGGYAAADMARSTGDAIGSATGSVANAGADAARQAAGAVGSAANRASEALGSGAAQAGDLAGAIGEQWDATRAQAADVARSARSQLGQLLDEQPLLLAAGAFAVGAAMAASLPLTETEERVIGDAAEAALQSGEAGSIGSRLRGVADAAKDEARQQGLTPEALKTGAGELRDRVTGAIGGVTGAQSPPA